MVFVNGIQRGSLRLCADSDNHSVNAIDSLTFCVPVIVLNTERHRDTRNAMIEEAISTTRRTRVMQSYAHIFMNVLVAVLHEGDLRSAIERHDTSKWGLWHVIYGI